MGDTVQGDRDSDTGDLQDDLFLFGCFIVFHYTTSRFALSILKLNLLVDPDRILLGQRVQIPHGHHGR